MEDILLSVLNMSLTASYVIAAILLVRLFLKKVPKVISYVLWAVAGFRLVIPFSFESVFSLIPFKSAPIPAGITVQPIPRVDSGIMVADNAVSHVLPAATPVASVNPMQVWQTVGAYLWLVGIAALLIYSVVSIILLKRQLRGTVLSEGNIYEAENLKTPFVLGFIRPKIYIPAGLYTEEKSYIILHERTHIRRFDHVVKLFAFLVLCIHWFNPLVWIAFILMTADMEMSCDERVLKEMGGDIKKAYSTSLLSMATGRHLINGSPLAFGEGNIKERIKNVLNFKKPAAWVIAVSVLLVAALSVGFATNRTNNVTMAGLQVSEPTASTALPEQNVASTAGNKAIPIDFANKNADVQRITPQSLPPLQESTVKKVLRKDSVKISSFSITQSFYRSSVAALPDVEIYSYLDINGTKYDLGHVSYGEDTSVTGCKTIAETAFVPGAFGQYKLYGAKYDAVAYIRIDDSGVPKFLFEITGVLKELDVDGVDNYELIATDRSLPLMRMTLYQWDESNSQLLMLSLNKLLGADSIDYSARYKDGLFHTQNLPISDDGVLKEGKVYEINNGSFVPGSESGASDKSTLSTEEPSETANGNDAFIKSWDRLRAYGAPDMSADEGKMCQQKLQNDIFGVTSYHVGGVYSKDFDINGINDLMVLLYAADGQSPQAYLCVYMNDDPVYIETFNGMLTAFGFMQYPLCSDIDHDGYPEIVYNIFTGGNGGAGSSVKGVLKYDKHELIPMDLPGDDSEDFTENSDVGYQVKVLFGKGENEYKAVCDGLGKAVDFKAQNAVNEDGTKFQPNNIIENGEAGTNCRGYSGFSIVNRSGRNYLLAEEYLYGEAGISDGVGFATFLIQWDGSGKPFVSEFGVSDKSVLSAAESSMS